jgi:hypothetical protein
MPVSFLVSQYFGITTFNEVSKIYSTKDQIATSLQPPKSKTINYWPLVALIPLSLLSVTVTSSQPRANTLQLSANAFLPIFFPTLSMRCR